MSRALTRVTLGLSLLGAGAGYAWPFLHDWGARSDRWSWLAALYAVGWLAVLISFALVAFGAGRRGLIWLVMAILVADILVVFVWFFVGGSHGAFS